MKYMTWLSDIRRDVPVGLDVQSSIFAFEGCELHYWLSGPPDAERVVLTHGNLTDHRNMNGAFRLLAQQYRVLTWDVRGHGLSRPSEPIFSAQQATRDLHALLNHLNWPQAHLVGHSMGGNISQELLFHHPERVSSLMAVDCTCNTLPLNPLEQLGVAAAPFIYRHYPSDLFRRQSAAACAVKPEIQAYVLDMFRQYSAQEVRQLAAGMQGFLHHEPQYHCPQPLAIVLGEQDKLGNIQKAARVWGTRDGVTPQVIARAGHTAHLDNPEQFGDVLLGTLASAQQT